MKMVEIPEITEDSTITLEHRFNYEDELKIADVAHICDDEIVAIYEICHTHHTSSEDRPEPWVEIDAKSLLTSVNTNDEPITIQCIRSDRMMCYDCVKLITFDNKLNSQFMFETTEKDIERDIFLQMVCSRPSSLMVFPESISMKEIPEEILEEIQEYLPVKIYCKNHFNQDQLHMISEFGIENLNDLVRHDKIGQYCKNRCLNIYRRIRNKYLGDSIYEDTGIQKPFGYQIITLDKCEIFIMILANGIIKYLMPEP